MTGTEKTNDVWNRIRRGQAKSALQRLAGVGASHEECVTAAERVGEKYPMVDMSSVLAELMAERAQSAAAVAGGLTCAAIAARAEQSARVLADTVA